MRELPVIQTSCSLSEADRQNRQEEIATLAPHVLEHSRVGNALNLQFANSDSVHRRIEDLMAKESECCPFLGFELTLGEDRIGLKLSAPNESKETLDAFERLLAN